MITRVLTLAFASVAFLPVVSARADDVPETPQNILEVAEGLYEQGYYQVAAERIRRARRAIDESAVRDVAVQSAALLSRCLDQMGEYEEALSELTAVEDRGKESADWRSAVAQVLTRLGRYEDAIEHCRAGLELDQAHMACRVQLGELYETLGRTDDALTTYEWFNELLKDQFPETADDLILAGRGLYRYSVLSQHPNLRERTRYVLQELLQYACERVDRRNWRGRLAAGDLLGSKYNLADAAEEYEAALRINPYLPEAHVGLGRLALTVWDFEGTEHRINAALRHNSRCAAAMHLQADLAMTERKYRQAADACLEALKVNPRDIYALSTLAAARLRLGEEKKSGSAAALVREINPRCAELEFILGRWLSAGRQFRPAEAHLRRAIELAPFWPEPLTELGRLHMETGQEKQAEDALKRSWELDPFNHRTFNTLDLLESLEGFKTVESDHFIIKFEAERDAPVAPYLSRYMESIYDELCDDYGIELEYKTIIEVFPTHAQFGVRITGRPWIHTIGASTGPVIAIDAPRPTTGYGRDFNWANVLRHEFTHTVTLAATENRIMHWFTEGLAVWQEDSPRSWEWIKLLAAALREDRLFTLESIDWGFIRPERPNDRQLAYAQSEWMVEYLTVRWGFRAVGDLIEAIRDGLAQPEAMKKVLGVTPHEFDVGFAKWARLEARAWGLRTSPLPPKVWLKGLLLLKPKDAALHAQLAEWSLLSLDEEQAAEHARKALELDFDNVAALEIMIRLALANLEQTQSESTRRKIFSNASGWLQRLLDADSENLAALKLEAASLLDNKREALAAERYRKLKVLCPPDPVSYRVLAALALEQGEQDEALGNLVDLWNYHADDPAVPIQIATLLARKGQDREALIWLERAVHIDPYRVDLHERLGALYSRFNRWEDATVEYEVLAGLEPDQADHLTRLAVSYSRQGLTEQAAEAARRAVALDPDSSARSLLNGRSH